MNQQIQSHITDLVAAIREEAMADVFLALSKNGLPVAKAPAADKKWQTRDERRAKGEKRSPESLAKLVADLGAYIKKNPGQRIETIGANLQVPTKDLALPIKKLLSAKTISKKGAKRATTYAGRS